MMSKEAIMYELPLDCVRTRTDELLQKYPRHSAEIFKALNVWPVFAARGYKQKEIEDIINAEDLLSQYSTREANQSFDEQKLIHKILVEEAGGEESDYESDVEELSTPETKMSEKAAPTPGNKRIFKYLQIIDKMVMLPPQTSKKALTIFMEIDDVFVNTFLCDENFGYMANPASKIPEHEFFLPETR